MIDLYSKCVNASGSDNDVFVGVKFNNNDVKITFPLGYDIPKDNKELKKSILSLIRTISLTKAIDRSKEIINDDLIDDFGLPIYSYLALIEDYLRFGLFYSKEKIYKEKITGRINWKRTIQKSTAVISNNNLIFMNPLIERAKNIDNVITEIEKFCLAVSIEYFGWYFGNVKVPKSIFDLEDKNYMLSILKSELSISFQDRKKFLINSMITILTGLDNNKINNKVFNIGTNNYLHVWETMVGDIYGTENVEDYYPAATWHLIDGKEDKASNLRPDTILYDKKNKKYYVLDAKYYHFCESPQICKLPGSDSVQKQITYASYIHLNKKHYDNSIVSGNDIYNAFVLPYNMNNASEHLPHNKTIAYYGYSTCDWVISDDDRTYPFHKVALIFIDAKTLIDKWTHSYNVDFNGLTLEIQKVSQKNG